MRPAVVLVATMAIAAFAGTAISLAQRPPPMPPRSTPSPPSIATIPPTDQPAVAFGFSIAADLTNRRLVLFGGVGNFAGTWLWDGAKWAQAHPATSPPGRYGASAAFDPQIGEVLLFGGSLMTGQDTGDTWAWDGTTWHEVNMGAGGPPAGAGSVMAWDAVHSEMVLITTPVGGPGGGETWIWNGARWVRDAAGSLGTKYSGALVALDPLSNALMAQGCCQGEPGKPAGEPSSTWRWDGSSWRTLTTAVHPLDGSSLEADPSLRRLVLCGCSLAAGLAPKIWVWNGRDWTAAPYPRPPVVPEAEVIDPADSQFLILGAAIAGVDALSQTIQVWTLRGTQWLRLGVGLASG
ncbi:MAG: hypothetical protein ACHQ4F_05455 [Candidatus Dormibacteria bacterium]